MIVVTILIIIVFLVGFTLLFVADCRRKKSYDEFIKRSEELRKELRSVFNDNTRK